MGSRMGGLKWDEERGVRTDAEKEVRGLRGRCRVAQLRYSGFIVVFDRIRDTQTSLMILFQGTTETVSGLCLSDQKQGV